MQIHDENKDAEDRNDAPSAFSAHMKKIRESKPTEADIEKLKAAIERLLDIALGDTGQSRRVASFLLAWWNAGECGGFDLTDLWNVDVEIAEDMVRVFTILPNFRFYPDSSILGYGRQFEKLAIGCRPEKEAYWSGEKR